MGRLLKPQSVSKMRKYIFLSGLIVALYTSLGEATINQIDPGRKINTFVSGEQLLFLCGKSGDFCNAYVAGVLDSLSSVKLHCLNTLGKRIGFYVEIVMQYLVDNPGKLHFNASGLVQVAALEKGCE